MIFSMLYKSLEQPIFKYVAWVASVYVGSGSKRRPRTRFSIFCLRGVRAKKGKMGRYQAGVLTSSRAYVQRTVSRLALNQHKGVMSYEDRCKLLKRYTLSDRRTYLSLVECYKIVFGCYHLKFKDFFDFATTRSTRANQYKR